ncbi:Phospholipid phosphatase- protein type 5, partial [Xenoophorus captivus]
NTLAETSADEARVCRNILRYPLVIMAGTVLLAYYFEYTDTFPVHIQGFFCYDKSFSKPYPGPDNTSKIPPMLIYSLVTAIPTLTVRVGSIDLDMWMQK